MSTSKVRRECTFEQVLEGGGFHNDGKLFIKIELTIFDGKSYNAVDASIPGLAWVDPNTRGEALPGEIQFSKEEAPGNAAGMTAE